VIGVVTAAVCLAIGLPFAHWLHFSAGRWRVLVLALIVITMFAGYLVRIYAWRSILGGSGLLNRGLEGLGLIDEPLGFLIYSRFAVVVALVHILLPYVVLVLYAGFTPISPLLVEAAEDLGASRLQRWRRLFLPLLAAPAASASILVFVLAASDYVTPQFLGGTNGLMLGVEVQANFVTVGNWALGAATAFLMLACFALCYGIAALALRRARLDRVRWVA
jgi:spermidine/putrescine transport system permease protein